jgi:hypothetical protein
VKRALLVAGLGAAAIALPPTGSAQAPRPCTSDETAGVQVTTRDRVEDGTDNPLYATHEVYFTAEPNTDATDVQITPQPGVTVLKPGKNGENVDLVIPAPPSLGITVTWEQPASDVDPTTCSASRTLTYDVLKAKPSKIVHQRGPRSFEYDVFFDIRAALHRQNLAPIELTLRRSARAKVPSARTKPLRWSIPMRDGERRPGVKGRPRNVFLGTHRGCELSDFSCGAVFAEVEQLNVDYTPLRRLSFNRPFAIDARFGVTVDVRAGADNTRPRPFGFDIQARQDGRLIARYRRAGVCREVRRPAGDLFHQCRISVVKSFPR